MSDTLLIDLQTDIAERLRADAVLGAITVVTERNGDVQAEVNRATGLVATGPGGARGICLIVLQATANPESQDAPGPLLQLKIGIRVLENPTLNTSGMAALTAARRLARILHHYEARGMASALLAATPCILPVVDPVAQVAYEVEFTCREAVVTYGASVQTPIISASSPTAPSTVTLSCGTPGAAIYYTTNGSHPRQGGAGSSLYSTPFAVSSAARIRAVAYATGLVASSAACADIG